MFSNSNYVKELIHELDELVFIMFDDGFPKCRSRTISDVLVCLRKLQKQLPEAHDKIVSVNFRYTSLSQTFPNWQDVNHIQEKMELKSLPSNMSARIYCDSYHPECNIM
jgi:hypothetical protein